MSESAAKDFHAFELGGWQAKAGGYAAGLGPQFVRIGFALIEDLAISEGDALLDIACGPGDLARAAADRGAVVTGVDFSPSMIAIAAARYPDLRFVQGSADALPFADATFDLALCSLGLQHFADPVRAVAEAARVLRGGGTFALTLWEGTPARHMSVFKDAVVEAGAPAPPLPPGLPIDFYVDEGRLGALLGEAGFTDIAFSTINDLYRTKNAQTLWDEMLAGSVRTAALISHQSEEMRGRIAQALSRLVEPYREGGALAIPMVAKAARAVRR